MPFIHVLARFGILIVLLFLAPPCFAAQLSDSVAKVVDQIAKQLRDGSSPESIFDIPLAKTADNQVRVEWVDLKKWFPNEDPHEVGKYIGFLAHARIAASFRRVSQVVTAYRDEAKFTPGVQATKVFEWRRESPNQTYVLLERKRELPLLLAGLKDTTYKIGNTIHTKNGSEMVIRAELIGESGKGERSGLLEAMEGFEYVKSVGNEDTLYVGGAFTLPNTGFLPFHPTQPSNGGKGSLFEGLKRATSKLDVGNQLYEKVTKSILDGAYETTAALVQATTEAPWRNKWPYQFTSKDTKEILTQNKRLTKEAAKKGLIRYP